MDIPIFDGTFRTVVGNTPFGYFDSDSQFIIDAPKIGQYIVNRLGFPIIDLEIQDINIYSAIEDSCITYSSEVNKFNIKDNLIDIQGTSTTDVNLTHKQITPSLGPIITISKQYGSEAGSGGNVDWKKGYITTEAGKQKYNLKTLWEDTHESGSRIEIKNVFHYKTPASSYFWGSRYNTLKEFGWQNLGGYGSYYVLSPVGDDVQRIQHIEFNQTVRQSHYSFAIKNNKLEIFPIPVDTRKIWFEYIVESERDDPLKLYENSSSSSTSGSNSRVSDLSNAPYDLMEYSNINSPGKSWIREYAVACTKEILGNVRSKYQSVPVPDNEITLDGDTLRSEAQQEKADLLEQLREILEATSKRMMMEAKQQEAEYMQDILNNVPLGIYIG